VTAKRIYVVCLHALARSLAAIGGLAWLDGRAKAAGRGSAWHWLRSLLAIHDIDQLIALDVPWWTYDAIDAVEARLRERPDARVFEYGAGASTVWLARRAGAVVSIEHDPDWHTLVGERTARFDHITLRHVPPDRDHAGPEFASSKAGYEGLTFRTYAGAIGAEEEPFDLIVIDGRARTACLRAALSHLKDGGAIVFDNTHRRRYAAAIAESGLEARVYRGRTPSLPYADETTVLIRPS